MIDASSWTIVDHWLPETGLRELPAQRQPHALSPGVRKASRKRRERRDNALARRHRDRLAPALDMPVVDRISLESITGALQRTYGSSPAIEGRVPGSTISSGRWPPRS
ncbi:MAG: hypothetical protein R3A46_07915 [Thermomicrobiales bacterium]